MQYAERHGTAVRRAGHAGSDRKLGSRLFHAILEKRSGVVLSRHEYAEAWSLLRTPDRRVHLAIPEMLVELEALATESPAAHDSYPFILMAGERRSYNANQIFREPAWRKVDKEGAMRLHPQDAANLGLSDGDSAIVESATGAIRVTVEIDDSVRQGVVTVPHGYGASYAGSASIGPGINRLTAAAHCEPFTRTPYHKYVPVRIRPSPPPAEASASSHRQLHPQAVT